MVEATYNRALIMRTIFVVISVAAVFFSVYKLTESPPVWYDEGFYMQAAINLAADRTGGIQLSPGNVQHISHITVGYPLIYPLAGWMELFGVSISSARSLMVLFILGFLLASYFLTKRLFGKELALGALALLTTLPTLYGNGKSVLGEVPGLLYLTLFLLSFSVALSSPKRKYLWLLASGLLAGLCVVTKPTFLVLVPAAAVGVFFVWKQGSLRVKEILAIVAAGALPLLLWLLLQFQGGDSLAGILSYYANPYQLTNLFGVILGNIQRLFTSIGPLYLMGVMGMWVCSLWIRLRKRETLSAAETISFVFSVLIIAAYTRTEGWYRYLFEAQAISLIFFPNALVVVSQSVVSFMSPKKIVIAIIAVLTIFGAYQVMFNSFVAESYNRNKTAFLESYFADVPPTTSFFIYNVPEVAIFIRGTNYYQYINPAGGSIGEEELPVITEGKVDRIILGTDAYANRKDDFFKKYEPMQTTHDYTILGKKQSI